jgi:hypothetical protein
MLQVYKAGHWSTSSPAFRCLSNLDLACSNVFTINSTLLRHLFLTTTGCLVIFLGGAGEYAVISFPTNLLTIKIKLRPVGETGQRVTPTSLSDYRMSHRFQFPCCLCPTDQFEIDYIESAIYLPVFGPYAGKYVAGCATNSCGYFSTCLFVKLTA